MHLHCVSAFKGGKKLKRSGIFAPKNLNSRFPENGRHSDDHILDSKLPWGFDSYHNFNFQGIKEGN